MGSRKFELLSAYLMRGQALQFPANTRFAKICLRLYINTFAGTYLIHKYQ